MLGEEDSLPVGLGGEIEEDSSTPQVKVHTYQTTSPSVWLYSVLGLEDFLKDHAEFFLVYLKLYMEFSPKKNFINC